MADGEKRDVHRDIAHPVEEKNHAQEEQQMVVAGDHMFGTKVREGNKLRPRRLLDEALVAIRNTETPCDSTSECAERRE